MPQTTMTANATMKAQVDPAFSETHVANRAAGDVCLVFHARSFSSGHSLAQYNHVRRERGRDPEADVERLLQEFERRITDDTGTIYRVFLYGRSRPADTWVGWLVFERISDGTAVLDRRRDHAAERTGGRLLGNGTHRRLLRRRARASSEAAQTFAPPLPRRRRRCRRFVHAAPTTGEPRARGARVLHAPPREASADADDLR